MATLVELTSSCLTVAVICFFCQPIKKCSYLFGIYQDPSTTSPKTPSLPTQTSFWDIFAVFPAYCLTCALTDLQSIRPQSYASPGHYVNVGRQLSLGADFLFSLVFQMVPTASSTHAWMLKFLSSHRLECTFLATCENRWVCFVKQASYKIYECRCDWIISKMMTKTSAVFANVWLNTSVRISIITSSTQKWCWTNLFACPNRLLAVINQREKICAAHVGFRSGSVTEQAFRRRVTHRGQHRRVRLDDMAWPFGWLRQGQLASWLTLPVPLT